MLFSILSILRLGGGPGPIRAGRRRPFSLPCPANHPAARRRPCLPAAPPGVGSLRPRPGRRWAVGLRRDNGRGAMSSSRPPGSLPTAVSRFAPHSPVYAAISPPNPLQPHSYQGKKARLAEAAPLVAAETLVPRSEARAHGHTGGTGEAGGGAEPAPPLPGGPGGVPEEAPPPADSPERSRSGSRPSGSRPRRASGSGHVTPT